MIASYDWPGGREAMLRFGPDNGPVVIAALPLFEEANRTRAFTVSILRALAGHGIAGALPDLPGTGESETSTEAATLADWRAAFAHAAASLGGDVHALAIRGGALVDTGAALRSRWHLAPLDGDAQRRELLRTAGLGKGDVVISDRGTLHEIAGNCVSQTLLDELVSATPATTRPLRTLRLEHDPAPADRHVEAAPLWRRAEPGNDPALAALLAEDIANWVRACEG